MKYQTLFWVTGFSFLLASCESTDEETAVVEPAHFGQQPVFSSADLDSDGQLSKTEVATYYHRQELAEYDLDGDSHISQGEWDQAHPSAAESDQRFNHFDKDGDGRVSESEAVAFVTEHVSFGDQFQKYDEDGDFNLHWKELDENAPTELSVTLFSIHPKNS